MVGGRCPPLASSANPRRMCCLVLSAFIASAGAFTAPNCLAPALSARKGGSFAARGPALSPAGALSRPAPSTLAPTLPLARQSRSELTAPRLGMETVFQIDNYLTLPFWAMMIFAPKARITRSIMNGWLPFVPLIFVYIYTLASSLSAPGALDIFKGAITLKSLSVAAQQPSAMAAIWAHLVTADLFVGRWIMFDALRNHVFAGHSLFLALFAGPVGLLSHLITREVAGGSGGDGPKDGVSDGLVDGMSDESLMDLTRD